MSQELIFPKCSVALCTYNGEKFLAQQLESILSQTIVPDEIVVVDDCSSDSTLDILHQYLPKFPKFELVRLEKNVGPVEAFRISIQRTSTSRIFLADQDDYWNPEKVEMMLLKSIGVSDTLPLLVYSDLEVINEKGELIHPSFWGMAGLNPSQTTFQSLAYGNVVTGCASLINSKMKELLNQIPKGVMMHDHWIALIAYGFGKAVVMDECLVKYRTHQNAVTSKDQASLFWKLKTQLNQFLEASSTFLTPEIAQIIEFKKSFYSLLSVEKQKATDGFIALKNQPFLSRKWKSWRKFS